MVRVVSSQTFDELAQAVYGDASLGPAIAELTNLTYADGLSRGEILVLPVRQELDERVRLARQADDRFAKGLDAVDRGAFQAAAGHFRAALDVAPQRLDVRYNYGLALMKGGDAVAATAVLEEVARLRPKHADSRYAFGSVLRQRRAWDRAIREFEAAVDLDRKHAPAAYALARTWEDRGDPDRARRAYSRFLARFPEDALAKSARDRMNSLPAATSDSSASPSGSTGAAGRAPRGSTSDGPTPTPLLAPRR